LSGCPSNRQHLKVLHNKPEDTFIQRSPAQVVCADCSELGAELRPKRLDDSDEFLVCGQIGVLLGIGDHVEQLDAL
jgi:hypothetical protein